jgi:hypothetical protein
VKCAHKVKGCRSEGSGERRRLMKWFVSAIVVLMFLGCSKDQPGPVDAQDVAVETPAEVAPEVTTDAEPEATPEAAPEAVEDVPAESTPEVEPEALDDTVDVLPPSDVPPDVPAE